MVRPIPWWICVFVLLSSSITFSFPSIFLFQIGHVTKTGDIAGPRLLEHIVDVVLYMEVGKLPHQTQFSL